MTKEDRPGTAVRVVSYRVIRLLVQISFVFVAKRLDLVYLFPRPLLMWESTALFVLSFFKI